MFSLLLNLSVNTVYILSLIFPENGERERERKRKSEFGVMASRNVVILLAVIFPLAIVSAKDFMVGDDKGWTINFDYSV